MSTPRSEVLLGALGVQRGYLQAVDLARVLRDFPQLTGTELGDKLTDLKLLTCEQKQELEELVREFSIPNVAATVDVVAENTARGCSSSPGAASYEHTTAAALVDPSDGSARFVTLRPLAQGGLGKVSVALDRELEREVAIKEILHEANARPDQLERFVAEAKITGGLEHPGIVPVYGLEHSTENKPRYAMRLIRGQSLQDLIETFFKQPSDRTLSSSNAEFRRLIRALMDACNAIAYAHSRGVIHRDIKPANIMLGKFGETLVVDWGLAKVVGQEEAAAEHSEMPMRDNRSDNSDRTSMGSILGTPGYMSPEQADGRLDLISPACDVFSLGATLYAILTGRPPFQGDRKLDTLRAARVCEVTHPREMNPDVPRALAGVCLKAMAKQPSKRYGSPTDLAADLDRWLAGEPVTATTEPMLQRVLRTARRHQTLAAAALSILIVGLVASLIANYAISEQRNIARKERNNADLARQDAVVESERAVAAEKVALMEAERAERNSVAALDIVDGFVKELADTRWSEFPGFEQERLQMVNLAAARCIELWQQDSENPDLKVRVVQLLARSSNLHRVVGERDKASSQMAEALEILDTIPAKQRSIELTALLTDTLNTAATNAQAYQGALAAIEFSERELALAHQRLKQDPESPHAKIALSRAQLTYAELCLDINRPASALSNSQFAADMLQPLVKQFNQVFALHVLHSYSYVLQGKAHCLSGNSAQASAAFTEAIELGEQALEAFPGNNNIINFAQKASVAMAELQFERGESTAAIDRLQSAAQVYQELSELHPDVDAYERSLAEIAIMLAQNGLTEDDHAQASQQAEQAQVLLEGLRDLSSEPPMEHRLLRLHAGAIQWLAERHRHDVRSQLLADWQAVRAAIPSHRLLDNETISRAARLAAADATEQ